ncbi:MAG: M23 family metallopeptidase [Stagnimonas sp.]|nr:M23 family metallopeptidase [Stagnimonas sp.]
MDIILVSHKRGRTWRLRLGWSQVQTWLPMALLALSLIGVGFGMGHLSSGQTGLLPAPLAKRWNSEISAQRSELAQVRSAAEENTRALARRIAQLNAQMMRLNAAGERMVKVADLDPGEFNFDQPPAVGGPEGEDVFDVAANQDPLLQALERFETRLSDRERQLRVLEDLLLAGRLQREVRPSGWPVASGFISSLFGYRTDPFTGRGAYHEGMDFAGREGSEVLSVAAGIVSFAGDRSGYGTLVEINHGNGYVTRYGHNSRVLVKVGETVRKGQRVARMGSSGRSTGPHVHFEVLLNGSVVNPQQYIQAAR